MMTRFPLILFLLLPICGRGANITQQTARVVFVSTNGSDATGQREVFPLPFQTLTAAKNAATYGDTVIVHPGTYYNATNLLKPGVNWFFYPGTLLTLTNKTSLPNGTGSSVGNGAGIFDDRFSGAVTCNIAGEVSILWSAGFPGTNAIGAVEPTSFPTNVFGAVTLTNPATQLRMNFDQVKYIALPNRGPFWIANTLESHFIGREIKDLFYYTNYFVGLDDLSDPVYEESDGVGFYWESGETYLTCGTVQGKQYSIWPQARNNSHSNLWVNVAHTLGSIYADGTSAPSDWRSWFDLIVSETDTNTGGTANISILGGGKHYFKMMKLANTANIPGIRVDAGEVWVTAQKVSSTNKYIELVGGTLHASIDDWENLGITPFQGVTVSGGVLDLKTIGRITNVAALVSGRYTNDTTGYPESLVGIPNALASPNGRTNMLPPAVNWPRRIITVWDQGKTAAGSNLWVRCVGSDTIGRSGPIETNITANSGSASFQSDGVSVWQPIGSWP